jgi:hypothetical protein
VSCSRCYSNRLKNVAWNCSFSLRASDLNPSNLSSSDITRSTVPHEIISAFLRRIADDRCKNLDERAADDREDTAASPNRLVQKIFRPVIERIYRLRLWSVRWTVRKTPLEE